MLLGLAFGSPELSGKVLEMFDFEACGTAVTSWGA
jgi:hypothetical protein